MISSSSGDSSTQSEEEMAAEIERSGCGSTQSMWEALSSPQMRQMFIGWNKEKVALRAGLQKCWQIDQFETSYRAFWMGGEALISLLEATQNQDMIDVPQQNPSTVISPSLSDSIKEKFNVLHQYRFAALVTAIQELPETILDESLLEISCPELKELQQAALKEIDKPISVFEENSSELGEKMTKLTDFVIWDCENRPYVFDVDNIISNFKRLFDPIEKEEQQRRSELFSKGSVWDSREDSASSSLDANFDRTSFAVELVKVCRSLTLLHLIRHQIQLLPEAIVDFFPSLSSRFSSAILSSLSAVFETSISQQEPETTAL